MSSTISRVAEVMGLASVSIIVSQLTFFNKVEFDYEKHGLKKGDYLLTLKTFEEPKKLGLVLVRNSKDDGNSFKLIKNVPGEYILDSGGQQFHRVPKGMLYARDIGDSNAEDFVFVSSVIGCRHFRLPDFQSIR